MDKVLSMLGLAYRARKVVSGEFSVEEAVKKGKACLVLIASDASDNTKKKFADKCSYRKVPYVLYADKDALGQALGQKERACAAFLDQGFSSAVLKLINKE